MVARRLIMKRDPTLVILSDALDKAVGATLYAWPLVLAICAVQAVTVTLPATEVGIGAIAVWCVLSPVRALIGFRTLVPELRFAAPWIVRLLIASALLYAVWMGMIFVPTLLITSSIRAGSSPSVWYALIPFVLFAGIGLSIWLGTKLSLAPTITVYEERPLGRSIVRSWRLTTGSFRQTFVFNLAIILFVGILYELPLANRQLCVARARP